MFSQLELCNIARPSQPQLTSRWINDACETSLWAVFFQQADRSNLYNLQPRSLKIRQQTTAAYCITGSLRECNAEVIHLLWLLFIADRKDCRTTSVVILWQYVGLSLVILMQWTQWMFLCICNIGVFAGTMMGITNTFATLPGFIGPAVVGALTNRNVSLSNLKRSRRRRRFKVFIWPCENVWQESQYDIFSFIINYY